MLRKGVKVQALQPRLHLLNKPAKICTALSGPKMPLPGNGLAGQLQRVIKLGTRSQPSLFSCEGPTLSKSRGLLGQRLRWLSPAGSGWSLTAMKQFISPQPQLLTPVPSRVGWHYLEARPEVGPRAHPDWKRVVQGPSRRLGVAVVGSKGRRRRRAPESAGVGTWSLCFGSPNPSLLLL